MICFQAARELESKYGIHCNLTLLFSFAQVIIIMHLIKVCKSFNNKKNNNNYSLSISLYVHISIYPSIYLKQD